MWSRYVKKKKFEIGVFNQAVRDAHSQGDRHKNLSDSWAETHYIEVEATSKIEAVKQLQQRYPASHGFRIVGAMEIPALE